MKYALVSPNEMAISYDGTVVGQRICEVADAPFDVASPLFWVDCDNSVSASYHCYVDGVIAALPVQPVDTSNAIEIPFVEQVGPNVVA